MRFLLPKAALVLALLTAVAATRAAPPPPLPADAKHLPDDGQDKSRAGSSQQRESAGPTPAGQPLDKLGALSLSKRQEATGHTAQNNITARALSSTTHAAANALAHRNSPLANRRRRRLRS